MDAREMAFEAKLRLNAILSTDPRFRVSNDC
jgi:hypothetical protein